MCEQQLPGWLFPDPTIYYPYECPHCFHTTILHSHLGACFIPFFVLILFLILLMLNEFAYSFFNGVGISSYVVCFVQPGYKFFIKSMVCRYFPHTAFSLLLIEKKDLVLSRSCLFCFIYVFHVLAKKNYQMQGHADIPLCFFLRVIVSANLGVFDSYVM